MYLNTVKIHQEYKNYQEPNYPKETIKLTTTNLTKPVFHECCVYLIFKIKI